MSNVISLISYNHKNIQKLQVGNLKFKFKVNNKPQILENPVNYMYDAFECNVT